MKRILATVCIAAGVLLPANPGMAGGSWLETKRRFYRPGEMATARTVFGRGAYEGTIRDGPFRAYLVQRGSWIRPGGVDRRAVEVGTIRIARPRRDVCCWVASLRFVVPEVSPGEYWLDYCNVPCTVEGIGDLGGAPVLIGATEHEARLGHRLRAAGRRIEQLERRLERELAPVVSAPGEEMRASPLGPAAEERAAEMLPVVAGIVAGLLVGLVLRRRPRVIALVPYDPLSPPTARRSTRRLR